PLQKRAHLLQRRTTAVSLTPRPQAAPQSIAHHLALDERGAQGTGRFVQRTNTRRNETVETTAQLRVEAEGAGFACAQRQRVVFVLLDDHRLSRGAGAVDPTGAIFADGHQRIESQLETFFELRPALIKWRISHGVPSP